MCTFLHCTCTFPQFLQFFYSVNDIINTGISVCLEAHAVPHRGVPPGTYILCLSGKCLQAHVGVKGHISGPFYILHPPVHLHLPIHTVSASTTCTTEKYIKITCAPAWVTCATNCYALAHKRQHVGIEEQTCTIHIYIQCTS